MTTLHWRIVTLVGWLAFFFNIERLLPTTQSAIHLDQGVYITGIAALLLPFAPITQRRSLTPLIVMIGFLYSATIAIGTTPFSGDYLYLHFTGFVLVMVTLVLSRRISVGLEEFRQAIETITLSEAGGRLRNLNEVRELVDIEMVRSRRFERPLSLVMIQADASSVNMQMHQLVQEVQRSMMKRYVLSTVSRVLSRTLRRTDLVIEDARPGRLLLVAPETNEHDAVRMGERVARLIEERLGITASFSTAAFPQQALTFDDLRNVAEQRLQTEPSTSDSSRPTETLELTNRAVVAPEKETARV